MTYKKASIINAFTQKHNWKLNTDYMNISYNWLKQYININITPDELSKALTSIGLEVGGVDEVQTVKEAWRAW